MLVKVIRRCFSDQRQIILLINFAHWWAVCSLSQLDIWMMNWNKNERMGGILMQFIENSRGKKNRCQNDNGQFAKEQTRTFLSMIPEFGTSCTWLLLLVSNHLESVPWLILSVPHWLVNPITVSLGILCVFIWGNSVNKFWKLCKKFPTSTLRRWGEFQWNAGVLMFIMLILWFAFGFWFNRVAVFFWLFSFKIRLIPAGSFESETCCWYFFYQWRFFTLRTVTQWWIWHFLQFF